MIRIIDTVVQPTGRFVMLRVLTNHVRLRQVQWRLLIWMMSSTMCEYTLQKQDEL